MLLGLLLELVGIVQHRLCSNFNYCNVRSAKASSYLKVCIHVDEEDRRLVEEALEARGKDRRLHDILRFMRRQPVYVKAAIDAVSTRYRVSHGSQLFYLPFLAR